MIFVISLYQVLYNPFRRCLPTDQVFIYFFQLPQERQKSTWVDSNTIRVKKLRPATFPHRYRHSKKFPRLSVKPCIFNGPGQLHHFIITYTAQKQLRYHATAMPCCATETTAVISLRYVLRQIRRKDTYIFSFFTSTGFSTSFILSVPANFSTSSRVNQARGYLRCIAADTTAH